MEQNLYSFIREIFLFLNLENLKKEIKLARY